jgi:hypothetical protein
MDRTVIAERNVVGADIMVPPLNSIHETIQHYQWNYIYTCACIVLTRLVRLFYANLEVAEDEVRGTVLQSNVDGHIITVDPLIISQFIGVPVLDLPASPFNEVVLPPSMDDLREFFHLAPQGEGRQTSIKIGALGPAHRMLAKIVQHNLWPVTRRSDLILKKAQFAYFETMVQYIPEIQRQYSGKFILEFLVHESLIRLGRILELICQFWNMYWFQFVSVVHNCCSFLLLCWYWYVFCCLVCFNWYDVVNILLYIAACYSWFWL